ncbi:SDR family oxidoreductase [Fodinicurvata sp. EGI_FJ10296]|uniref:SDR family oxidoreductase n=1 Tax=Fodinicurvata sp. EGI_FJ10296 TaxID=3231908 RepID=UPI0034562361
MSSATKVAVITGAGTGVGSATTKALAAEGYAVVLTGRRREPLETVAEAVAAATPGAKTLVVPADVGDPDQVRSLFDTVQSTFGRLDLLFNNAGTGTPPVPFDEIPLADWQKALAANLTGAFLCSQQAFRLMKAQTPRGGRIVNNGSISAYTPRPNSAPYTATKHAISGLTKSCALDGRAFDIACGQIDIGNAATEMTEAMKDGVLQPDGTKRPEPRMNADDVARAVIYMASLPLDANVLNMTVMATKMPFVGRG